MTNAIDATRINGHRQITAPAPPWFQAAIEQPVTSHDVEVDGCSIHYLRWPGETPAANQRGLLFVHGGGAHANWWRFIAPFFTRHFRVAAIDLSGMGDSGERTEYTADQRVREIRAVLADAGLGDAPFVVGHSYGGYMMMRFAATYGDEIGGAVIVDSPIRHPEWKANIPAPEAIKRVHHYASFEDGLARFRLLPAQPCANDFIVEFIARHSLKPLKDGWTWKFGLGTMTAERFEVLYHEDLQGMTCRAALIFGQNSALVSRETAAYMSTLMGPDAPIIEIPEAHHHVMLDQPLSFVAALRTLLDVWDRADVSSVIEVAAEGSGIQ